MQSDQSANRFFYLAYRTSPKAVNQNSPALVLRQKGKRTPLVRCVSCVYDVVEPIRFELMTPCLQRVLLANEKQCPLTSIDTITVRNAFLPVWSSFRHAT